MKKTAILLAVATTMMSCSSQEEALPQTTTVTVAAYNEFGPTTSAKNIERGPLYAWISEIQIIATHQSGYSSTTDFTIVENGTLGAESKFLIEDVQIGENSFTASTKTTEPERLEAEQLLRTEDFEKRIETLNARNPYAVYASKNPLTYTIVPGLPQNITIPLQTENSRFIAIFTIDDNSIPIKNYKINCFVNNQPFGPKSPVIATITPLFIGLIAIPPQAKPFILKSSMAKTYIPRKSKH